MACGLPVIITDFGDNGKWVQDGVNGFLMPPSDHGLLGARILQLLEDENLRQRFGELNAKIVDERNNTEKEMGKMNQLYVEMVRKYGKGGQ
jgi:glycosyltransferase involved in cell wall biosynthesis